MGKITKRKTVADIVFNGKVKLSKEAIKKASEKAKRDAVMTREEWNKIQKQQEGKWPAPAYMAADDGRAHNSYRDETFEVVTRWMDSTKIEYRPHAKAPGSKSHIRYEKYAVAKTVGEALRLGTFPIDWCWDYERGFIKVLGPVRDEPFDISKIQDESELTDVDLCVKGWMRRELAKKLGLNVQDLSVTAAGGESVVMRAHRLVAQREAKKRLADADKAGRPITEDEVLKTLQEWRFAKCPYRLNVLPDGQDWVWSDTLGLTRGRDGDIHLSRPTMRYPDVTRLICRYLTDRLPKEVASFKFTSLNLNCNYAGKLHRDANNFGPSCIKAFGEFSGGELNYWQDDDKTDVSRQNLDSLPPNDKQTLPIKNGIAMFNGNCAHSVNDFKGERYSIVYFTAGCHAKAKPEDKANLISLGVPYPAADEDPYKLLGAPRGYGKPAMKAAAGAPPSFRFWESKTLSPKNSAHMVKSTARTIKHAEKPFPTASEKTQKTKVIKQVLKRPAASA